MPSIHTDAILHYNVGEFGDAGYGVPNWGNDFGSSNLQIVDLVNLIGANVFNIMHHEDVNLRTPPSVNTLERVHKLYLRISKLLESRAVPPGERNMETVHVTPAGEVFKVFPCPYFLVRSPQLKRWCGWAMMAMSEAMQHTENAKAVEISTTFAGQIGQYFTRIYEEMALELLGKTLEQVSVPGFALTDADFRAYDPTKFFTSTELTDTVHPLDLVLTEDRIRLLRQGINTIDLPDIKPWPTTLQSYYTALRAAGEQGGGQVSDSAAAGATGVQTTAGIIPPPPSP